ncbi:hypothetical protein GSI_02974 [Ganoderma sinense ZZ0214-1]|uniref:Uncharacterized protein n=1 Tax=Ganoderma sinense ZZ0214-1 TaxID=1077348 RepID=A0A2G8SN42_9APHY|nr:hypothetical protein GSI_02974 [Ganoderma sinense ZZ0214-1]
MRTLRDFGDHFREVYLQVENLWWNQIFGSLPAHSSLLTRLTIDSNYRKYPSSVFSPGMHYFGGIAQGLQHLRIHGVPCLPTDQFPNLTHFAVSDVNVYPLSTILSVFANMPSLEVLSFALVIEEGSATHCVPDTIVELPHLRQLTERHDISIFCDVLQVLPMIKIPSTCLVQIDEQGSNDVTSIAGLLYREAFPQNLTRLRIMPHHDMHPMITSSYENKKTIQYYLEVLNDAGTSGLILGIHSRYSGLWTAEDRTEVTDTFVDFLSDTVGAKLVSNPSSPPIDTRGLVLAQSPHGRTEIPESIVQPAEDGTFCYCPDLTSLYVYACRAKDVGRARRAAISPVLGLEWLVRELSVTVGVTRLEYDWWKPCAIPEGWSRHGVYPWPDRREY